MVLGCSFVVGGWGGVCCVLSYQLRWSYLVVLVPGIVSKLDVSCCSLHFLSHLLCRTVPAKKECTMNVNIQHGNDKTFGIGGSKTIASTQTFVVLSV